MIPTDQSDDDYNAISISSFNKWGKNRRSVSIGTNIAIRFGRTISLGIKYYDKDLHKLKKRFGISFDDFIYYINELSINKRYIFFQTFQDTMCIKYISEHFVCWKDVKYDRLWQQSVDTYLNQLILKILDAYENGTLKKPIMKTRDFQRKLVAYKEKYQQTLIQHKEKFQKQKKRTLITLYDNESHEMHEMCEPQVKRQRLSHTLTSSITPNINIPNIITQNLLNIPIKNQSQPQFQFPCATNTNTNTNTNTMQNQTNQINPQNITTVRYRIYFDWNGLHIQQL